MKKLKFNKVRKLDWGYFFKYTFLILLSALLFVDILVALPLTERISNSVSYDLNTKSEDYWAKEYTLELDTTDLQNKERAIESTKSLISKRLNSYGVEKTTITYQPDGEIDYLKITVQTTKDPLYVTELIRSPFRVNVVTRKTDVDFEGEENPYAPYLGENYDNTQFTRDNFRNVYITKLKNSNGDYSYFALYKTWVWNSDWKTFLQENTGQTIGVSIDGFVTPVQIPYETNPVFALPLSAQDESEAKLINILYNSGVMPINYTLKDQIDIQPELIETDYVKITEGILLATILIYAYLMFVDRTPKNILVFSGLSTVITLATWISYLKITGTPIDIFLLSIEVITMIAILRITSENKESRMLVNILVALIASLSLVLGTGYVKLFANDMLILIIGGNLAQMFSRFYITKINSIFKI